MAGSLVVDELLIMLGLETDDPSFDKAKQRADQITTSFENIARTAAIATTAVVGAAALWVNQFATAGDTANKLARRVNGTVEEIQELDYVARRSGSSVNLMRNSIEKLNAKASEAAKYGGEMAKTFMELGINAREFAGAGPGTQMEMIADAFERIPDPADKTRLAMKLFEEEGRSMVTVFENGSEGIRQMRADARRLGLFSAEDAKRAEEYQDLLLDAKTAFTSIRNEVGAKLLPEFNKMLKWFREFFIQNRELISQNIVKLFVAAGHAMKALAAATAVFLTYKLGTAIMSLVSVMRKFSIVTALTSASVLLIPILVGAATLFIAGLIQEVWGYFNGMDTVLGEMEKKFPIVGEALAQLRKNVDSLISVFAGLLQVWEGLINLDWSKMRDGFNEAVRGMSLDVLKSINPANWISDKIIAQITPDFGGATLMNGFGLGNMSLPALSPYAMAAPSPTITNARSNSTVVNDNRQYTFNGQDIGEVKRVIGQDNAASARNNSTGIKR